MRNATSRTGVAAALIAGVAIGLEGGPAYAADGADLGLTVTGTTIAAGTSTKVFDVTVTNEGPGTATGVAVVFDLSELDRDKVDLVLPGEDACDVSEDGDTVTCGVTDIPEGQRLDLGAELRRKAGAGAAGTITVAVAHDGTDPDQKDNAVTADVEVGGAGPDLYAYAPDVPFNVQTGRVEGSVAAGSEAVLFYEVGNQGDAAVAGFRITVTLPEHVTFAAALADCEYNADETVATCGYDNLPLIPAEQDTNTGDDQFSALLFPHPVKVAADAPAPGTLAGGVIAVEPVEPPAGPERARVRAAGLPEGVQEVKSSVDVDESDNADEFAVRVGAPGGTGGGEDGLPVTGAATGLIGGVGLAVTLAGVLLLLASRRRRVVLIAPHDETSTG